MEAEKDAAAAKPKIHPAEKKAQEDVILAKAAAIKVCTSLRAASHLRVDVRKAALHASGAKQPSTRARVQRKRGTEEGNDADDASRTIVAKHSHWSYVIAEAKWLSIDIRKERAWKRKMAFLLAYEIAKTPMKLRPVVKAAAEGGRMGGADSDAVALPAKRTSRYRCALTLSPARLSALTLPCFAVAVGVGWPAGRSACRPDLR